MRKTVLLALFIVSPLFAYEWIREMRCVDGKIMFPVAVVNGELAWNDEEKKSLIDKFDVLGGTTTVEITDYEPSAEEIAVSTSIKHFKNADDFRRCLIRNAYFKKRVEEDAQEE